MSAVTASAAAPLAAGRRRPLRGRLMVPTSKLNRAVLVALVGAVLCVPLYSETSSWLALGVALTLFVLMHGASAAYAAPWIPGIMTLGACVQWILAPWFVYEFQGSFPIAPMVVPAGQYFTFAVPATICFVLGLYLPVWRRRPEVTVPSATLPPSVVARLERSCNAMVVAGVVIRVLVLPFSPYSLRFALYLASLLGFVGALTLCLLGARGWYIRVLAVLGASALDNAASLQFLELLLWCGCVGLVICYRYKPRPTTVLALLGPGLLLFTAINAFKMLHRDEVRSMTLDNRERAAVTSTAVFELAKDPGTAFGSSNLVATVSRLNEGFVTSRLLAWVPTAEPYARGETIVAAMGSALLPRVLSREKYVAGGAEIVPRFTGIKLINGTSISLSIPGEMYANFGLVGSWVGSFLFGWLLGLIYASFARRAAASPAWWAWVPLILFGALSAEQSIGEILNSISKALVVAWVAMRLLPGWRDLPRRTRRTRPQAGPAIEGVLHGPPAGAPW